MRGVNGSVMGGPRRLMAMAKQAGSREANELWLAFLHKVKRGR